MSHHSTVHVRRRWTCLARTSFPLRLVAAGCLAWSAAAGCLPEEESDDRHELALAVSTLLNHRSLTDPALGAILAQPPDVLAAMQRDHVIFTMQDRFDRDQGVHARRLRALLLLEDPAEVGVLEPVERLELRVMTSLRAWPGPGHGTLVTDAPRPQLYYERFFEHKYRLSDGRLATRLVDDDGRLVGVQTEWKESGRSVVSRSYDIDGDRRIEFMDVLHSDGSAELVVEEVLGPALLEQFANGVNPFCGGGDADSSPLPQGDVSVGCASDTGGASGGGSGGGSGSGPRGDENLFDGFCAGARAGRPGGRAFAYTADGAGDGWVRITENDPTNDMDWDIHMLLELASQSPPGSAEEQKYWDRAEALQSTFDRIEDSDDYDGQVLYWAPTGYDSKEPASPGQNERGTITGLTPEELDEMEANGSITSPPIGPDGLPPDDSAALQRVCSRREKYDPRNVWDYVGLYRIGVESDCQDQVVNPNPSDSSSVAGDAPIPSPDDGVIRAGCESGEPRSTSLEGASAGDQGCVSPVAQPGTPDPGTPTGSPPGGCRSHVFRGSSVSVGYGLLSTSTVAVQIQETFVVPVVNPIPTP